MSFHWSEHLNIHTMGIVEALTLGAVGTILLRTARGKDWNRRPFLPYTVHYATTRVEKGLTSKPVDLRVTGGMLGSIGLRNVRVSGDRAVMVIAPDAAITGGGRVPNNLKARYLEEGGRVFMALNRADLKRIWATTKSDKKVKSDGG